MRPPVPPGPSVWWGRQHRTAGVHCTAPLKTARRCHPPPPGGVDPHPMCRPPPPSCDIPSFVGSVTGPWTLPRPSLCKVRRVIIVRSAVGQVRADSFVWAWGPMFGPLRRWLVLWGVVLRCAPDGALDNYAVSPASRVPGHRGSLGHGLVRFVSFAWDWGPMGGLLGLRSVLWGSVLVSGANASPLSNPVCRPLAPSGVCGATCGSQWLPQVSGARLGTWVSHARLGMSVSRTCLGMRVRTYNCGCGCRAHNRGCGCRAHNRGCGCRAHNRGCGCRTHNRGCGCRTHNRGCGCRAHNRGCGCRAHNRGCGCRAHNRGCGCRTHNRGCGCRTHNRGCGCRAHNRGCGCCAHVW